MASNLALISDLKTGAVRRGHVLCTWHVPGMEPSNCTRDETSGDEIPHEPLS